MFEPIRGGTRGGQAEFKWSDVSADKDREHYLGHSVNAPTGRWQKNKDIHWYNRDKSASELERLEEIRKVKEAEAEALSIALGFGPTGANAVKPEAGSSTGAQASPAAANNGEDANGSEEKDEKRRRKAERKEEKRARKEARRAARDERDDGQARHRDRERSRSPLRRRSADEEDRYARRSRSPTREHEKRLARSKDYDEIERQKERERHRLRWDKSATRDRPSNRRRDD